MRIFTTARSLRALTAAAMLATAAAACGDDPIAADDEPNTAQVVLTIGSGTGVQTVTWNVENGAVSPATVTVTAGQSLPVTSQFLRADGSVDPVINAADFRLDFDVTGGTGVSVVKNGNLAATFTATGSISQSITVELSLEHLGEGHTEYGPSNALTVRVQ